MPLKIDRIQALCFDIDGTLSDTDDAYVLRLARWLKPIRAFIPKQNENQLARRLIMALETPATLLHGLSDRLGLDTHFTRWSDRLINANWQSMDQKFILMHGVRELLEVVAVKYPLAVVSARGERTALAFLDQQGLTHFFQVIVTGQTVRHTKPFPDPILHAAQAMEVPPEACLMIGDTTVDILAGKAAGAQAVGVLCGFGELNELQKAGADLILQHTSKLSEILQNKAD